MKQKKKEFIYFILISFAIIKLNCFFQLKKDIEIKKTNNYAKKTKMNYYRFNFLKDSILKNETKSQYVKIDYSKVSQYKKNE